MTDLTDILWEQAEPYLFTTKDAFLKSLEGWTVTGHRSGDELAWITCVNGPEFHFATVGRTRILPLRIIREFLQGLIDQHGYCLTKTPHHDERQHRFNRRFGFVEIGRDAFDVHYRLNSLPRSSGDH